MLSASGRLQLIKSVLNNLPLHFMSLFRIPYVVYKRINALERRFFWGVNGKKRPVMSIN